MGCTAPNDDEVINKFIMVSKTNDDAVDALEIHWTLRKYYENIPMRVSSLLAKFADADNNGSITRKEFNRFASLLEDFDFRDELFIMKLIFKAADLNDNGSMDAHELE